MPDLNPYGPPRVATGPLWPDAYAIVWPRSGGAGACSHQPPDSCPDCDGTAADMRELGRAAKRAGATR